MKDIHPPRDEHRTTGRKLVVLSPTVNIPAMTRALSAVGMDVVVASERGGAVPPETMATADAIVFDRLHMMVVTDPSPAVLSVMNELQAKGILLSVEDEGFVHPLSAPGPVGQGDVTWGLGAIGVEQSPFAGRGIRVAIFGAGFDMNHPDFQGRKVVHRSFVPGETAPDGNGFGTYAAGIACGPRNPSQGPRYGVAYEAELYIVKVLSDQGGGADGWIMNGINWALENGCRVLLLPLGSARPPTEAYRALGERALAQGAIIVGVAGQGSHRTRGDIQYTGSPANVVTILSVGAVDSDLRVADFSNGGKIDIVGPGVGVLSSWSLPQAYNTLSGTTAAAAHVAGVLGLLMEADPHASAPEIWRRMLATARQLNAPASDVGAGLVQAPVSAATAP
ncbi:S8 family serine peptidase [Sorangium sp. So ce406]|uniref:S8 family serine peptidase n=1 Tax=Sorangium sp. So ce406 TaxID=3133311 RepID=UPI003F5B2879